MTWLRGIDENDDERVSNIFRSGMGVQCSSFRLKGFTISLLEIK